MKRFNKNIILFIVVSCFIITGCFSSSYFSSLWDASKTLWDGIINLDPYNFVLFTKAVDSSSSKELAYHDQLMDINSLKDNILLQRIIRKDNDIVIKSDTGHLYTNKELYTDSDIEETVQKIEDLYQKTISSGAEFLYVSTPDKGDYFGTPSNVENYSKINHRRFVDGISKVGIPIVDFGKEFRNKSPDEIFFYTDHHWTPENGFEANAIICDRLNTLYGFDYDERTCDLDNYDIKVYRDYFLGSYGKKVGTFFTWHGPDDISLITPKFETHLLEEKVFKNEKSEGNFEKTIIDVAQIEEKDMYHGNPYYVYCGGDFRLQTVKNNKSINGDTILLIRDSTGAVVVPFLSMNCSELHIVDIRNNDNYIGDTIDVYEYIDQFKPDYVVVLYQGSDVISSGTGRFNFDLSE